MKKPVISERMKRRHVRREKQRSSRLLPENAGYEAAKGWAAGGLLSRGGCLGVMFMFTIGALSLKELLITVN